MQHQIVQIKLHVRFSIVGMESVSRNAVQPKRFVAIVHIPGVPRLEFPFTIGNGATDQGTAVHYVRRISVANQTAADSLDGFLTGPLRPQKRILGASNGVQLFFQPLPCSKPFRRLIGHLCYASLPSKLSGRINTNQQPKMASLSR